TASKKKKSLTISAPIPCNTAFPPDHPAVSKLSVPDELAHRDAGSSSGNTQPDISNSDDSSSAESLTSAPSCQSVCSESESDKHHTSNGDTTERPDGEDAEEEDVSEEVHTSETPTEEEDEVSHEAESVTTTKHEEEGRGEKEDGGEGKMEQSEEMKKGHESEVTCQKTDSSQPPGFLYKAVALETQESDEGILLLFSKGDVLLVFADEEEEKVCGVGDVGVGGGKDFLDKDFIMNDVLIFQKSGTQNRPKITHLSLVKVT
ncbi:bridging integrator 2b, partial [Tachysurus ichikawai]